jgi:hypothetical protein
MNPLDLEIYVMVAMLAGVVLAGIVRAVRRARDR